MTVGNIRKRDQGWRLREAASLKFKKGREGKEQEEHTKSLSRTRKRIFFVLSMFKRASRKAGRGDVV
jgi:hypothetical protein